jgi:hypothetical protein
VHHDADARAHDELVPDTSTGAPSTFCTRSASARRPPRRDRLPPRRTRPRRARHDVAVTAGAGQPARPRSQELVAALCPSESLTTLKRSRSRNSSASGVRRRAGPRGAEQRGPVGQAGQRVAQGKAGEALLDSTRAVTSRVEDCSSSTLPSARTGRITVSTHTQLPSQCAIR